MQYFKIILLSFVVSIFFQTCDAEPNTTNAVDVINPSNYYEALNVSYGNDINQKFDLYLPANRTSNTKTIILVHGGGWSSGDKAAMNPFKDLIRLELTNVAIVNINYRLADANNKPYPMQIDDITTIINYLKTNKSKYTISDNFGFIGTSAGAHLSLLWSYAFDTNKNINMVCSIVGPTNFTDPAYLENESPELQAMIDLFGVNPTKSFLEEVSPFHQVTATGPPTIMFYGGKDPLIPTTQGTGLHDKLESLNVTNEFTLYPNGSHGWIGADMLDTWLKLKTFMQAHL